MPGDSEPTITSCFMCGQAATVPKWAMRRPRQYCSETCSKAYRAKISSETMARTNRQHASERMKRNNPMKRPESKAKMTATMKAMGHAPTVRGGNGRPLPVAEAMLIALFADMGFEGQSVIPTRQPRGSGYPTCYKIDCGNPSLKLGLEAEGVSHTMLSRQEQDRKKDAFLAGLGWTVLRFTNAQILSDPGSVVTTVLSTISRLKGSTPTSPTA